MVSVAQSLRVTSVQGVNAPITKNTYKNKYIPLCYYLFMLTEDDEAEGLDSHEMETDHQQQQQQQDQTQPMEEHQSLRVPMPEFRVEPPGDQVPTSQGQETPIERVPYHVGSISKSTLNLPEWSPLGIKYPHHRARRRPLNGYLIM